MFNAKNGKIIIDNTSIDYICFGKGEKALVMIPGLGDGLKTVKGYAVPFSLMYREYAKNYRVYLFSRRNNLPKEFSTKEMAKDIATAMLQLNIPKADVLGVSQGGMVAQYLAIDYPEMVNKLCIAVSISKPNDTMVGVVSSWIKMAKADDYKSIFIDTAEKSYSEKYLKKSRWMFSLLSRVGKPKDFNRFITMANACLNHNCYEDLHKINCPTLIIGGDDDKIVTANASTEIANAIPDSSLYMYNGLGHAAYEEAKDFNHRVIEFFDN